MRKLSDIKDEEAMDVLADIIDPAVNIFGDPEIAKYQRAKNYIVSVKLAIKNHKEDVIKMMSILEGVPVEEYHYNLLTLPKILVTIFNDPELQGFFPGQGEEKNSEEPSGSVMESIEGEGDTSSSI